MIAQRAIKTIAEIIAIRQFFVPWEMLLEASVQFLASSVHIIEAYSMYASVQAKNYQEKSKKKNDEREFCVVP